MGFSDLGLVLVVLMLFFRAAGEESICAAARCVALKGCVEATNVCGAF